MDITTASLYHLLQQFAPGAELARWRTLAGGFSAEMIALEVRLPTGESRKVIARLHGARDLAINPDVALDQYRLLQSLTKTRLPVPRPLHLDQTSETFDQPILVLEYVEGSTEIPPADLASCLPQMAEMLARIHNVDPLANDLKFLAREEERNNTRIAQRPEVLDETLQEGRIRDTLENAWPLPTRNTATLLHGDFWSGNVLWGKNENGREIVAVIDWENALIGDPVEDVANARMEIFWDFGAEAMEVFTREYQSMSNADFAMLAWWDLCAALRPAGRLADWATSKQEEDKMRDGHALFVEQAMRNIA